MANFEALDIRTRRDHHAIPTSFLAAMRTFAGNQNRHRRHRSQAVLALISLVTFISLVAFIALVAFVSLVAFVALFTRSAGFTLLALITFIALRTLLTLLTLRTLLARLTLRTLLAGKTIFPINTRSTLRPRRSGLTRNAIGAIAHKLRSLRLHSDPNTAKLTVIARLFDRHTDFRRRTIQPIFTCATDLTQQANNQQHQPRIFHRILPEQQRLSQILRPIKRTNHSDLSRNYDYFSPVTKFPLCCQHTFTIAPFTTRPFPGLILANHAASTLTTERVKHLARILAHAPNA